jgi:hypothetical protein
MQAAELSASRYCGVGLVGFSERLLNKSVDYRVDLRINMHQAVQTAFDGFTAADFARTNRVGEIASAPLPQRAAH